MRTIFDEYCKDLIGAALDDAGEVVAEHRVMVPALKADIWFRPDPVRAHALARAGLLGRMAARDCMIEPYRNTPGVPEVLSCTCKQYLLRQSLMPEARRERDAPPALPALWIVSAGRPDTVIDSFRLEPMPGWPAGCYRWPCAPAIERRQLVVVRELPETRETLLLRLLGRGATFAAAARELDALPDDAFEHQVATPVIVAFWIEFPQTVKEDEMHNYREIYDRWHERVLREGREHGRREGHSEGRSEGLEHGVVAGERTVVHRLLTRRFGPLSEDVTARIQQAAPAELERWADRLLTADSLAAVFDD